MSTLSQWSLSSQTDNIVIWIRTCHTSICWFKGGFSCLSISQHPANNVGLKMKIKKQNNLITFKHFCPNMQKMEMFHRTLCFQDNFKNTLHHPKLCHNQGSVTKVIKIKMNCTTENVWKTWKHLYDLLIKASFGNQGSVIKVITYKM